MSSHSCAMGSAQGRCSAPAATRTRSRAWTSVRKGVVLRKYGTSVSVRRAWKEGVRTMREGENTVRRGHAHIRSASREPESEGLRWAEPRDRRAVASSSSQAVKPRHKRRSPSVPGIIHDIGAVQRPTHASMGAGSRRRGRAGEAERLSATGRHPTRGGRCRCG